MPPIADVLYDGFNSLPRGMDSGVSPDLLEPGQYSFAVNCICRGGFLKPRPGYKDTGIALGEAATGLLQGVSSYDTEEGYQNIIAQISGRLYRIDVRPLVPIVLDITPLAGANNATMPQAWMYQAERNMIIQNGIDRTWFFDGAQTRRAGPKEIPTGRVGYYAMGRVWQSLTDGRTFIGGDLVYGDGTRDSVLKVTENDFLNESKVFAVPATAGEITAITVPAVLDTSLGQGPIHIFTENSVFTISAPFNAAVWKNLQTPIQTISMIEYGAEAQDSTIRVNGDIYYRSLDGIRSHLVARREFGRPGNTVQSAEMDRVLAYDDKELLRYGSAILFDNRLLMTASPAKGANGNVYHRGIISLDFDPISGMARKESPVYDSVWTETSSEEGAPRHRVLKLVKVKTGRLERAFAFTLNLDSEIELWEISRTDWFDNQGTDDLRIVWYHESKNYNFGSPRWKKLQCGFAGIRHVRGLCEFDLKFRPDDLPYWVDWEAWSECSKYKDCEPVLGCLTNQNYMEQYRPRRKLHQPPDTCEKTVGLLHRLGHRFQTRLQVRGYCEIRYLELQSNVMPEPPLETCPVETVCKELVDCPGEDFIVSD